MCVHVCVSVCLYVCVCVFVMYVCGMWYMNCQGNTHNQTKYEDSLTQHTLAQEDSG